MIIHQESMPHFKLRDHLQIRSSTSSSDRTSGSANSPPTPALPEHAVLPQTAADPNTVTPIPHPSPKSRRYPVSARAYKPKDYQYIVAFTRSSGGIGPYTGGRQIHSVGSPNHHHHGQQQQNSQNHDDEHHHDANDGIVQIMPAPYGNHTGTESTDMASTDSSILREAHADQQNLNSSSSCSSPPSSSSPFSSSSSSVPPPSSSSSPSFSSSSSSCASADIPISDSLIQEKLTTSDHCKVCIPEFGSWGAENHNNDNYSNYTCIFEQLRDQKKKLISAEMNEHSCITDAESTHLHRKPPVIT